jgi:hypothetical protein
MLYDRTVEQVSVAWEVWDHLGRAGGGVKGLTGKRVKRLAVLKELREHPIEPYGLGIALIRKNLFNLF